jgi:RNA polymerase sigma factor (sigma-70 family)
MSEKMKKYLDAIEERDLIARYQTNGDQEALDILMATHTPYVQKEAAKQFIKFNKTIEYDDLVQQGKIGLIKAINKFKLNRVSINPETNKKVTNQRLLTYAHGWIVAEIQNLFHRSPATHIPAHTLRAIFYKVKKPGCNTEERKALARKAMRAESLDNLSSPFEGSNQQRYDIRSNGESSDPTFDAGICNIFSPAVMQAISKLSEQEFKIFSMRYGLEHGIMAKATYIADELNIPLEDVEKTLKRAKRILSKNLTAYPK